MTILETRIKRKQPIGFRKRNITLLEFMENQSNGQWDFDACNLRSLPKDRSQTYEKFKMCFYIYNIYATQGVPRFNVGSVAHGKFKPYLSVFRLHVWQLDKFKYWFLD